MNFKVNFHILLFCILISNCTNTQNQLPEMNLSEVEEIAMQAISKELNKKAESLMLSGKSENEYRETLRIFMLESFKAKLTDKNYRILAQYYSKENMAIWDKEDEEMTRKDQELTEESENRRVSETQLRFKDLNLSEKQARDFMSFEDNDLEEWRNENLWSFDKEAQKKEDFLKKTCNEIQFSAYHKYRVADRLVYLNEQIKLFNHFFPNVILNEAQKDAWTTKRSTVLWDKTKNATLNPSVWNNEKKAFALNPIFWNNEREIFAKILDAKQLKQFDMDFKNQDVFERNNALKQDSFEFSKKCMEFEDFIAWWKENIKPQIKTLHAIYYPKISPEVKVVVDSFVTMHSKYLSLASIKNKDFFLEKRPFKYKYNLLNSSFSVEYPFINQSLFSTNFDRICPEYNLSLRELQKIRDQIIAGLDQNMKIELEKTLIKLEHDCAIWERKYSNPNKREDSENRLVNFLMFR
jgi:hypothetical protein